MDVLVSKEALARFRPLLDEGGGGDVRWAHLGDEALDPMVAWLSTDLFYSPDLGRFLDVVRGAPGLRLLQSGAAGTDLPFVSELRGRGVRVATSHVTAVPIAEYVVGAVLRHYQRPEEWDAARAERAWRHHEFREIAGTTWLVVGMGSIGAAVARRVEAFDATVVGVRRADAGRVLDLLPDADVVVLSRPPEPDGRPLVDAAFLARMQPGSVLVNVARGSLVDEGALVDALDGGVPAHAVVDVTRTEPLPADSPLWSHPRVTLTPHSSGGGLGRYERGARVFAENLARFRDGRPLLHEVSP